MSISSDSVRQEFISHFHTLELAKNHRLQRASQYANRLYYLEEGVVRTYYHFNDKEVTSWLYTEGQFFTSWHSFINRSPSFEYIECIEQCSVRWITREEYEQLLDSEVSYERFMRNLLEEQVAFMEYYFKGFLFMSAKEKYDLLLLSFPAVTQRVNLGYVASLLGISQETLSRIRSQK